MFSAPALRSFGIGGMLTVFASLFYAMTFLPALLGILGPRVNSLSVTGLIDRIRRALGRPSSEQAAASRRSRWEWIANTVMAHPIVVIIPTLSLLLLAGLPFLRLQQGIPDAYTLPAGLESREAAVAIQSGFEAGTTAPIVALVDVPGDPTSEANVRALVAYGEGLGGVSGVERVESPFTGIPNPATGQPLDRRRARRPVRPAAGRVAAAARRPVGPVRPRVHRPLRRHQPAPAVVARRDRGGGRRPRRRSRAGPRRR